MQHACGTLVNFSLTLHFYNIDLQTVVNKKASKNEAYAVWTGLEPATPCVTGRYSNQLNYQTNDFILKRLPQQRNSNLVQLLFAKRGQIYLHLSVSTKLFYANLIIKGVRKNEIASSFYNAMDFFNSLSYSNNLQGSSMENEYV